MRCLLDKNGSIQDNNNVNFLNRFTLYAKASQYYFVCFLLLTIGYFVYLLLFIPSQPSWDTLKILFNNSHKIFASLTLTIALLEGGGLIVLFFRVLWDERKRKNQEARNKEKMDIIQPFLEWDLRRKAAAARGEEFNEPMPSAADFNIPDTMQESLVDNTVE